MQRHSPRGTLPAALTGAVLGLGVLPVCECGAVPATRRLLATGAPLPLGIAFLLAAPAANPIVLVTTWIAFDGQPLMVFGRLILTVLIAAIAGAVLGRLVRPESVLPQRSWVRVKGRIGHVPLAAGGTEPAILATAVEAIDRPENPYLYP